MTTEIRSRIMRSVRSKNTGPERRLRSLLWHLGYRYRLYCAALPGRPDVAMIGRRKAIFVHGCFWHQHSQCSKATVPKTRLEYWRPKLRRNRERDIEVKRKLEQLGWSILVIWQCELRTEEAVVSRLLEFLGPARGASKRRAANSTPATSPSLVVAHSDGGRS